MPSIPLRNGGGAERRRTASAQGGGGQMARDRIRPVPAIAPLSGTGEAPSPSPAERKEEPS